MQPAGLQRQVLVHDSWTGPQSASRKAQAPAEASSSRLAARAWRPRLSCSACSLLLVPAAMLGSTLRRRRPGVALKAKKGGKKKGGSKWDDGPERKQQGSAPVSEGAAYAQETRKIILDLDHVDKKAQDGTPILKNVSLGMYLGAKIGILGRNGAGKSTVMRILAGKDDKFLGNLTLEKGIRVGHLEQEPVIEEETVIECLEQAVLPMKQMIQDFEDVSVAMAEPDADIDALMAQMDDLQAKIDAADAFNLDSKLDQAMEALRCPPREAKIETLSGGEKRRVAICRLLLSSPDILLLDEPTNHLDAQSVAWLERYLFEFKGTVVAITHDRYFLDNVAGWILELDEGKGIPFEGNYSSWLESKAKRLGQESSKKKTLQRQMQNELEFINSMRSGQQKKGKARLRKYADLEKSAEDFTRNSELDSIVISPGPRLADEVVRVKNLSKGYGERLLISDATFELPAGAVVGIIGPNGAGKTTLFNMITGKEQPDSGDVVVGSTVAPMYVDQSRGDLDPESTVFEEVTGDQDYLNIGGREVMGRQYCSWFNFKGSMQSRRVKDLSGGERNRLQLAKTLRLGGNVLMLDEPSNDLDVDTLRALETAIENFAGTVLCVSHDRWFLDRIATHILAYEGDSQVRFFPGNYGEYEEDRIARTGIIDPSNVTYKPMPTIA